MSTHYASQLCIPCVSKSTSLQCRYEDGSVGSSLMAGIARQPEIQLILNELASSYYCTIQDVDNLCKRTAIAQIYSGIILGVARNSSQIETLKCFGCYAINWIKNADPKCIDYINAIALAFGSNGSSSGFLFSYATNPSSIDILISSFNTWSALSHASHGCTSIPVFTITKEPCLNTPSTEDCPCIK